MIPPGVVSDRIRKIQTFKEPQPVGEQVSEQRESTTIGHEPQAASDTKGRTSKDRLPRQISSTLPQNEQRHSASRGLKNRNTSSRPSVASFHSHVSNGRTNLSRPNQNLRYSASTELRPSGFFLTSYPDSTDPSRTASTAEKCQDAMDMLEQYSISRPEGWFSDRAAGTPDQVVQNEPMISQICHSCVPDTEQAHLKLVRKKTIAAPTEVSNSVKNNPFFMADRETKTEAPEPAITTRLVQMERKPKLSDCLPDRLLSKSPRVSHIQEACSDAGCKATHTGHLPIRHSIGCITGRSMGVQVSQGNELDEIETDESQHDKKHAQSLRVSPSKSKLQMKIDQLHHHGQDLHNSQHIMEHLSAGVKTLEGKETDGNAGVVMEGNKLSVLSQPVVDHSLSQDDSVNVKTNLITHELSRDSAVQGEIEPQPPNLSDYHRGDQHPSPKSHEPNDDTRNRGNNWAKPPPDSHGEGQDSQEDHSGSVLSRTSSVKPRPDAQEPRRGLDSSREGNERVAPPALQPSVTYKGRDVDRNFNDGHGNPNPRNKDSDKSNPEATDISEKKEDCPNCNPSQYSSPKDANNTFQIFVKDEPKDEMSNKQNSAVNPPLPHLKVTDIEHSLALKNVEELMVESHQSQEAVVEEPTSSRLVSIADDQPRKDSEISTLIYDPSPVMPYDHMCVWRAYYTDLKSQINQLELESSCLPGGKSAESVGPSHSQPHDDIGIEGLTIVMHFRGKDDLVINTDLREGLQEHLSQR
ncbi:hypothetical protein FGRMN_6819 [Fusarium graminum]|nr:hypothetical protein FGRMN_6819 [Fusarium graminum]